LKNTDISKVLKNIAALLELKGDNIFKARAYQKVVRTIENYPKEIEIMLDHGEDLKSIPGIGEALAKKVTELVTTGKLAYYDNLKAEFPAGITELLSISGIGVKTVSRLYNEIGICSVKDLEQAIIDNKITSLFRPGDKTTDSILLQIRALTNKEQPITIKDALSISNSFIESLYSVYELKQITSAGSIRRYADTVGNINLIASSDSPESVISTFITLPQIKEILSHSAAKASAITTEGVQVELRIVYPDSFGSFLQYFTGSKKHNMQLFELAQSKKLKLSKYGLANMDTDELEKFTHENELYHRLNLQYIPPELRESHGEIERAMQGTLPSLIQLTDVKGDLHVHTNWSDGNNSIMEMALAAKERGYQYLAITDHSAGRGIAHGLNAEKLGNQMAEIKLINEQLEDIHVFSGIEVDIRADGSIDMPHEMLCKLNIVIGAVHSAMNQDIDTMTKRVLGAIENPDIDIIAHPTCRLLGQRVPVSLDMEAIFNAAAKNNKILEINAMPNRLDLNDEYAFRARELGVKLVINTDAHDIAHLDFMHFGVGVARRAWCEVDDVVNTASLANISFLWS
jgi:DNA polymerase (family 10)